MSRTKDYEAIVLKTHDVGEADRFCILFTKERGRIAARARGVRKLKSRMGGVLLAPNHISVTLTEGSVGFSVNSVLSLGQKNMQGNVDQFAQTQNGIELLLSLLHDEEPLQDIFDLTQEFLDRCTTNSNSLTLPFTVKLLHLLGILPGENTPTFAHITPEEKAFLLECKTKNSWPEYVDTPHLSSFCTRLIEEHGGRTLRAPKCLLA